ncbi:hypothetical protein [Aminipila sp.]|uniref:hypothetical protein n=1 Tax=Aminipila sp. TaxID=2060095 RepID=UPI002897A014|nr:hypothetical protein [Aminipila sp.]
MKKRLLISIAILIVIIVLIVLTYMNFFIIGEPRSEGIYIGNISVSDNLIIIKGGTESSAEAYKGFEYDIINSSLYIKIKYVQFASRFYTTGSFTINIKDELSTIDKIYLTDGSKDKLIWSN